MDFDQITDNLYVGAQFGPGEWVTLEKLGITVNVNLRAHAQDSFDGSAPRVSLWLPTPDLHGPDVETIEISARFIASMIAAGRKVYLHCRFGTGRAPTVGAGYLVTTGLSADEALNLMKRQRPVAKPTNDQIARLHQFAGKWAREGGG